MNEAELKRFCKRARYKLGTRYVDRYGVPWTYVQKVKKEKDNE